MKEPTSPDALKGLKAIRAAIAPIKVATGEKDSKRIEFVDHLHEYFLDPCVVKNGAYMAPSMPGFSIEIKPQSIADYTFKPD